MLDVQLFLCFIQLLVHLTEMSNPYTENKIWIIIPRFFVETCKFMYFDISICCKLYTLVPAAEIRDHETGLVSGSFYWFQSRQLFLETHETEANSVSCPKPTFSKRLTQGFVIM